MTNRTTPATSRDFTSDGHFSTITFRISAILLFFLKKAQKGRFSSGPFSSTKCGMAIGVSAAVPSFHHHCHSTHVSFTAVPSMDALQH
jgi:hypothetical protein